MATRQELRQFWEAQVVEAQVKGPWQERQAGRMPPPEVDYDARLYGEDDEPQEPNYGSA